MALSWSAVYFRTLSSRTWAPSPSRQGNQKPRMFSRLCLWGCLSRQSLVFFFFLVDDSICCLFCLFPIKKKRCLHLSSCDLLFIHSIPGQHKLPGGMAFFFFCKQKKAYFEGKE